MTASDHSLWAVIEARDAAIARMHAMLAQPEAALLEKEGEIQALRDEIDALVRQVHEKEAEIAAKEAALAKLTREAEAKEAALAKLTREAEAKEAVINEMGTALGAYRATFAVLGIFIVPLNHLVLGVRSVIRRSFRSIAPRLGVLNQHAPRKLLLPDHYSVPPALEKTPRISIVTPSFNQAAFIERTLASVLDQSYPNLEYRVQDGGSSDGTTAILARYADRLAGWESSPDSGQSQAINRGFAATTGEIMAWLNSDDILLPGALAYVAHYFNRHPGVDVVYGHRILIDENDRQIGRWMLPPHDDEVLSWADFVPQETLFWRRRIWDRAGGRIDESFRFAMDWDMLVRFREAGARFVRLPRFLAGFRIHPQQKTSAAITDVGFNEMDRIRERLLGRVPSRIEVRKAVFPYLLRHMATDMGWRIQSRLGLRT